MLLTLHCLNRLLNSTPIPQCTLALLSFPELRPESSMFPAPLNVPPACVVTQKTAVGAGEEQVVTCLFQSVYSEKLKGQTANSAKHDKSS